MGNTLSLRTKNRRDEYSEVDLICPITRELPLVPVVAEDGRIYEKSAIEKHIKMWGHGLRSPVTNAKMGEELVPALDDFKTTIGMYVKLGVIGQDMVSEWNRKVIAKAHLEKEAEDLLKKARSGDSDAIFQMGQEYYHGKNLFEQDYDKAFLWFSEAHRAGSVLGTLAVGHSFHHGYGCKQSDIQAMMFQTSAADRGSDFAALVVGIVLADEGNTPMAIHYLRKSLEDCPYEHMEEDDVEKAEKLLRDLTSSTNGNESD